MNLMDERARSSGYVRIPRARDHCFRSNVTGDSGGMWLFIPREGGQFPAVSGIVGHDPERAISFVRNEPAANRRWTSIRWLSSSICFGVPMPAKRSVMRKIKEILRLKFDAKLGHERISVADGASKGAVSNRTTFSVRLSKG